MYIIIILIIIAFLLFLYFKYCKVPKLKSLIYVDGGLGTGKSAVSLTWAIKKKRLLVFKWYIRRFLCKLFRKEFTIKKPVLYSNLPLANVEYVPVTLEMIERKVKPIPNSVIWIDEMSLVADQTINPTRKENKELCDKLTAFFKLMRHWSHNGYCIFNCQSTSQLNYSIKECISDYFYIHSKTRLLFHSIVRVQERVYSRDNDGVVQVNTGDIENELKVFVISNKVFKQYDNLAYSSLTDGLKEYNGPVIYNKRNFRNKPNLKAKDIISFMPNSKINEELQKIKEEKKENETKQDTQNK